MQLLVPNHNKLVFSMHHVPLSIAHQKFIFWCCQKMRAKAHPRPCIRHGWCPACKITNPPDHPLSRWLDWSQCWWKISGHLPSIQNLIFSPIHAPFYAIRCFFIVWIMSWWDLRKQRFPSISMGGWPLGGLASFILNSLELSSCGVSYFTVLSRNTKHRRQLPMTALQLLKEAVHSKVALQLYIGGGPLPPLLFLWANRWLLIAPVNCPSACGEWIFHICAYLQGIFVLVALRT